MKILALATAALGLTLTGTPAFAGDAIVRTTVVSTDGLDLTTREGQKMLDWRIEAAARKVCDIHTAETGSRMKSLSARTCYRKALNSAKRQMAMRIADQKRGS